MGFHRPLPGFLGTASCPPLSRRQSHRANSRLQTKTCWHGLLSEGLASPKALGSREPPHGERDEGSSGRGGSTHPFTHLDQPGRTAGRGLSIPRGTKGSWSLAPPPPSPLCRGVGRASRVPAEGRGPAAAQRGAAGTWTRAGAPRPGRRGRVGPAERWTARPGRAPGAAEGAGSPGLRGYQRKSSLRERRWGAVVGGGSLQRNEDPDGEGPCSSPWGGACWVRGDPA